MLHSKMLVSLSICLFITVAQSSQYSYEAIFDDSLLYLQQTIQAVNEECQNPSPVYSKIECQAQQWILYTTIDVLDDGIILNQGDDLVHSISHSMYLAFTSKFAQQNFDDCYTEIDEYLDSNSLIVAAPLQYDDEQNVTLVYDHDVNLEQVWDAFVNNPPCFHEVVEGLLNSAEICAEKQISVYKNQEYLQ